MPCRDRVLVRAKRQRLAVDAGSRRGRAASCRTSASASSVRPAPSRPVMPSDFARVQREARRRRIRRCASRPLDLERPAAVRHRSRLDGRATMRLPVISSARRSVVDLGCRIGADLAAVAQHRNALGDLDDFLQPMADEDHRDAQCLQPAHEREQRLDLMAGQRRGRLVHEEQPGAWRQGRGRSRRAGAGDASAPTRASSGRSAPQARMAATALLRIALRSTARRRRRVPGRWRCSRAR